MVNLGCLFRCDNDGKSMVIFDNDLHVTSVAEVDPGLIGAFV